MRERRREERRHLRRGHEITGAAELRRAGRVVPEAGRVQHEVHVAGRTKSSRPRPRSPLERLPRRARCARRPPDREGGARTRRDGRPRRCATADVVLDWRRSLTASGVPRAGQGRADHGRCQAGGRRDLPKASRDGREPDAALPRLRGRGAAPAGRAQSHARRFGRADPGGSARAQNAAVAGRADGAALRPPRCARQQRVVVLSDSPVGEITAGVWDDLMGTNLRAPMFLSQAAAPALRKSQGAIVNIVDIHAERPLKNYVVYSVAKAGLAALTRSLARELAPEVRVNAVAPGPILWPDDDVVRRSVAAADHLAHAAASARASRTTSPRPCTSCSPKQRTSPARRSASTAGGTSPSEASWPAF